MSIHAIFMAIPDPALVKTIFTMAIPALVMAIPVLEFLITDLVIAITVFGMPTPALVIAIPELEFGIEVREFGIPFYLWQFLFSGNLSLLSLWLFRAHLSA